MKKYVIFVSAVVLVSCKSSSRETDARTSEVVNPESSSFSITGGNTRNSADKGTVAIVPLKDSTVLGVGSGFFAADRCVLTAAHNFKGVGSGAASGHLVFQTPGEGVDILDPKAKAPREVVLRINTLPQAANPNDLAFAWISSRKVDDPDNPRITIYNPRTPIYEVPKVPAKHTIIGFGGGTVGSPVQKTGTTNATLTGRPTTQAIPSVQLKNIDSGLLYDPGGKTYAGPQPGDSGGPIIGSKGPVAVIEGMIPDPNNKGPIGGSGVLFAPFEPWIRLQLEKFCKPQGGAGAMRMGDTTLPVQVALSISGGAFYTNAPPGDPAEKEISSITCSDVTGSVCGSPFRADHAMMANVVLTAKVTPPQGYIVQWGQGACTGASAGSPFKNNTCSWTYNPDNETRADKVGYETVTYQILPDAPSSGYGPAPGG